MSINAALRLPEFPEVRELPEIPEPAPRGPRTVVVRTLAEHRRSRFRAQIRVLPCADPAVEGSQPLPAAPNPGEVTRLMRLVLEVLDRRRPQSHLENWVPIGDFRALVREENAGPRRLRSVRPSAPLPGVLEVCAMFDVDERARAMVGRFEFSGQEWRCTLLRMI
jgi:hypothetical protein